MPPSAEATGFIARYIDFLRGMRSNPGAYPGFSTRRPYPFGLTPASNPGGLIAGISLAGLF
jgi:hypothetical protein